MSLQFWIMAVFFLKQLFLELENAEW
jgi:hypothetical protein